MKVWSWDGQLLGVVIATSLWSQWINNFNSGAEGGAWRFTFDRTQIEAKMREEVSRE